MEKPTTLTITLPAGLGEEIIKYAAIERRKAAIAAQAQRAVAKQPDPTLADDEYLRQHIVNNLVADFAKAKTDEAARKAAKEMAAEISKKLG